MARPPVRLNRSELASALVACRGAFVGVALFSGMSNILMLTGSFYMLEIYDRVIPSRSIPTLLGIAALALLLYAFQGFIDLVRGQVLVRIGGVLDERLSGRVFEMIVRLPAKVGYRADGLQSLRDLDNIRSFLSSLGPTALFDLPWMPLYLGICFAFHFWIGITALIGAIILIAMTALTEMLSRGPSRASTEFAISRTVLAETSRRNAEVILAMGMTGRMRRHWSEANQQYMSSQQRSSDVTGGLGSVVKVLRTVLQSTVLSVGAVLVISQEATGGIIIAGSILAARALAPVDLAIANWRGFVAARQSWARLQKLLAVLPELDAPMALPSPVNNLVVENASVAPPGVQKIVARDVSFTLNSGSGLGIVGPSASGKSSLARLLVGVWRPHSGWITLDGAPFDQWLPDVIGNSIGYLPQDVELLSGTVAQNIARFDPDAEPTAIVAAAKVAGVHDIIMTLSQGYDSDVGEQGMALSAGQQQRVALARALYGDPFLVVLDEPNSNLDGAGEDALSRAISSVRDRGGIVIVIAHRTSVLSGLDHVLVMGEGRMQAFGPKDEVMNKFTRRPAAVVSGAVNLNAAPRWSAP